MNSLALYACSWKKFLKRLLWWKGVTCFRETCLPPRPTRRRANPRQRRGAERLVREYLNRGSHDPPSSSLHHGQPPLWSKRAWEKYTQVILKCYHYKVSITVSNNTRKKLLKHKWTTKFKKWKNREKSVTYRVINTACLPSESKSSIRVILFLSLWWPRMHLHKANNNLKKESLRLEKTSITSLRYKFTIS